MYGIRLRRPPFATRNHEWDYNDLLVVEELEEKVDVVVKHLVQTQRDWELVDLIDVRDTNNSAGMQQGYGLEGGALLCIIACRRTMSLHANRLRLGKTAFPNMRYSSLKMITAAC